ncbi:helix-turn-helix transcriptional regulator [Microbacterium foliorum]|uniref:helix-turn-helix transcriptional regulator n=1 Tax=Rothia terrae TaxID=396015 RepID=UPI00343E558B
MNEKQIGKNIARLRGEMSQGALALRMKELGHKWVQSTVSSVENGERPLKLSEASDLSSIFRSDVDDLLEDTSTPEGKVASQLRGEIAKLAQSTTDLEKALKAYSDDYERLRSTLSLAGRNYTAEDIDEIDKAECDLSAARLWNLLVNTTMTIEGGDAYTRVTPHPQFALSDLSPDEIATVLFGVVPADNGNTAHQ